MKCTLCPQNCNAQRDLRHGKGFCKMATSPKIARSSLHFGEEPCISGTNGSGTIFFSGCTLKCIFCQNYEISAKNNGKIITPTILAEEFKKLEFAGAHNINLVSPTPYIPMIINAINIYKPSIPIVFNCGGYEKVSTLKMLEGIIDVYLPDFKYSDDSLGEKYSKCKNYSETATAAIKEMLRQTGSAILTDEGLIQNGTLVRHLVLPNHTKNSIGVLNILDAIRKEFFDFPISLMSQYLPLGDAMNTEKLSRKITHREYLKVKNHLLNLNFDGYIQDLSSATTEYVPDWDY